MRYESQQEILAQLREIYDGKYSKAFGNGKIIQWSGKVGLIAACTPAYDRHYASISSLGDRFILYRMKQADQEEMGLRAQEFVGQEENMRQEIRDIFQTYLNQFKNLSNIHLEKDDGINRKIVNLACFCAFGRCAVERDYRDRTVQYIPLPEGSPRLTKQFMTIGAGVALAQGKNIIDDEVFNIIKKIALSILPAHRCIALNYLWQEDAFEHVHFWKNTGDVAEGIGLPKSTVKLLLEDLQIVGMLNRQLGGDDDGDDDKRMPYRWQINDRAWGYANKSGIFNGSGELPF